MTKYKAVICDVDGTLVVEHPRALPTKKVKDAIEKLQKKGIPFCLATGRPLSMLYYLFDYLQLDSLVILDNGAVIYDTKKKKVIWESTLDNDTANRTLTISLKYSKEIGISTDKGRFEGIMHISENIRVRKYCVIGLDRNQTAEFIKEIEEKFKNVAIVRATSYKGKHLTDVYISDATATKQHAVLQVAELLGVPTDAMIGIGDYYNDFPLLMACGLKVVMGNAVADLKEIADYIAPSVEDDGVADILDKFIFESE